MRSSAQIIKLQLLGIMKPLVGSTFLTLKADSANGMHQARYTGCQLGHLEGFQLGHLEG